MKTLIYAILLLGGCTTLIHQEASNAPTQDEQKKIQTPVQKNSQPNAQEKLTCIPDEGRLQDLKQETG